MWDHGAMSHGCQGVEGMGAMRWTWEGCMWGGGESGEGGAGGHALGWGERGGRSGRAWIGALSSHLIGAGGHGAMGSVHGGGGCVGGGSHVRHGAMSWSP